MNSANSSRPANTCLDTILSQQLKDWSAQGLTRSLRLVGSAQDSEIKFNNRNVINFSSNNYLGISNHPSVISTLQDSADQFGVGSGASRLICGSQSPHAELESEVATWKQVPACLTFTSGYATATGTIPALVGSKDFILLDKLSHACLIDGARLSGATIRVFPHNNMERLEKLLQWAQKKKSSSNSESRILIVTESVFSMDGDTAPLQEIVNLKNHYGAWLMVDEAHSTGVQGPAGAGCIAALGLQKEVDVQMGTFSKGLGVAGGFIAGSQTLIDWLIHRARSFVFSTSPPPSTAAAALTAVQIARSTEGDQLREKLQFNIKKLKSLLKELPCNQIHNQSALEQKSESVALGHNPILPWIVGDARQATHFSNRLLEEFEILAPAIRFPTVPREQARIRFTVSASHNQNHFTRLEQALQCISTAQDPNPGR